MRDKVWYGIVEFNVPVDTVYVISETVRDKKEPYRLSLIGAVICHDVDKILFLWDVLCNLIMPGENVYSFTVRKSL